MSKQTALSMRPEFSPLSLARMIWKQKIPAAAITVCCALVTFFVVRRLPSTYKAEAVVLVDSQKIPEKYVSSTVNSEVADRLATISQQILSSTALKKVIDDFDLYHDERKSLALEEIIEKMRKDIEIKLEKGWTGNRPGAFRVGYRGPVPTVVAGVSNRIANLFVEENLRAREVQAEGTSEFIVNQLQDAKHKLDEIEGTLSKYKLSHNGELPQQENSLIGTLGRLQTDWQANQEAVNRAQQNKVMLETSISMAETAEANFRRASEISSQVSKRELAAGGADDPSSAMQGQKTSKALELQLEVLRGRYAENYPEVRHLRAELERVQALERRAAESVKQASASTTAARSDAGPRTGAGVQPQSPQVSPGSERLVSLKAQLTLCDEEIKRRSVEHERIRHDIASLEAHVDKLPVREQEMSSLMRDYEISKANYKSLLDKKLAADMAAEMERRQKAERFTIVDPARVPGKPFQPNRPLLYGAGAGFGLALGIAFALAREFKSNVLLGEWELPEDVVILGRIPNIQIAATPKRPPGSHGLWPGSWRFSFVFPLALFLILSVAAGLYAMTRLL